MGIPSGESGQEMEDQSRPKWNGQQDYVDFIDAKSRGSYQGETWQLTDAHNRQARLERLRQSSPRFKAFLQAVGQPGLTEDQVEGQCEKWNELIGSDSTRSQEGGEKLEFSHRLPNGIIIGIRCYSGGVVLLGTENNVKWANPYELTYESYTNEELRELNTPDLFINDGERDELAAEHPRSLATKLRGKIRGIRH